MAPPWRHSRPRRPAYRTDMKLRLAVSLAAVAVFALSPAPGAASPAPGATSPPPGITSPAPGAASPAPGAASSAPGATSSGPGAASPAPGATSPAPGATSPAAPGAPSPPHAPTTSTSPAPAELTSSTEATTTQKDDDDCYDDFEYSNNPELLERLKKYDVAKVLEGLGGAPGKVNATWRDRKDVPDREAVLEQGAQHLADNTNSSYWLYEYASTDYDKYVRLEHALLRSKGTADEYVDVRGEVWWSPEEGLCGALRHAKYRQDDKGGFVAEVLQAHCNIFRKDKTLSCYGPDSENPCAFCISSTSGALIASLVG
ncbi:mucin-13-like [Frankliniella occidentalis]|uniref:Mucin-13-like n=1 Tax=Frankliniella occidentalis TaxID=133901 RepID=A0A6J1SKW0_FRAOC|nr:mucin-13-like [Frankliniella occidentalis]